jgi:DNA-binding SARP family transcriptional activator
VTGVSDSPVRACVLGPLEVTRDGRRVEPTSPKQRALLIDLLLHRGELVRRDRLIDDLWGDDPPTTAAGVLQNYVSQLRQRLGSDAVRTVGTGYAAGEHVVVDVDELEAHLERAHAARSAGDNETVRHASAAALALWRGEALADVLFERFAQAEVSRLAELRGAAVELQLEAEIAAGRGEAVVASLEAAVAADPLRERLWWLLMLALYRSGRQGDALRAFQRARTMLVEDLGIDPSPELRNLEQAILEQRVDVDALIGASADRRPRRTRRPIPDLLGRSQEWSVIEEFVDDTRGTGGGLLLLMGEPGIGKTRLLDEAAVHVEAAGGIVIAGRVFEAERGRPYGVWVDALRGAPLGDVDEPVRSDLAPLLPELSERPVHLDDPNRLYDAAVQVISGLAKRSPVAILLDDVHWLDEGSLALLQFAVRHLNAATADVAFLATARPAELDDNAACRRFLERLRRDDALHELPVGPLAAVTIAELTEPIAPGLDSARIAQATNGNPLYAVEMARALARGDEPLSRRVDALIGDRLARLHEHAFTLVPWIAAVGRAVAPRLLGAITHRDPIDLFAALGDLERHGVLRANDNGDVDFTHELVRSAAYERLSAARRTTVHARIAAVFASQPDPDDSLAADTARHADAGGDSATCTFACARAARRCVRLLAYRDAEELVALGRSHAGRLDPIARLQAELELIHVLLHPGIRLRDPGELRQNLTDLCAQAQRLGLDTELSTGLLLLARAYHWGWGDIPRARALLERAVSVIETSRGPDIEPLLEGARCLAYLEIDMPRTARLFDELGALPALVERSGQYQWGRGLIEAWRGHLDAARHALTTAIELASASTDHWMTFECTARLALFELEAGADAAAGRLCAQLGPLADKLGDGSERAYAVAVGATQAAVVGSPGGDQQLDDAIARLERIDARFLVPDLLGIVAERLYRDGLVDRARDRAEAARATADDVARPFEAARAHAVLACIAAGRGDGGAARRHLQAVSAPSGHLPSHVEGLRRDAERLTSAIGRGQGG